MPLVSRAQQGVSRENLEIKSDRDRLEEAEKVAVE
jgi:hypothetical protein